MIGCTFEKYSLICSGDILGDALAGDSTIQLESIKINELAIMNAKTVDKIPDCVLPMTEKTTDFRISPRFLFIGELTDPTEKYILRLNRHNAINRWYWWEVVFWFGNKSNSRHFY